MKKTLLIVGDSFACDWSKKYKGVKGWPNLLDKNYNITNIAEAGVSEYKIYLQLKSQNLSKFDKIIVSHTSAYRIPIQEHPIHKGDLLHNKCDIIFSDVKEHIHNPVMKTAYDFYSEIFYPDYFIFINTLIFNEIYKLSSNAVHITFFDNFYDESVKKMENIFLNHKGNINHLDETGNLIVYNQISEYLF